MCLVQTEHIPTKDLAGQPPASSLSLSPRERDHRCNRRIAEKKCKNTQKIN